jgi:hypothetical protein
MKTASLQPSMRENSVGTLFQKEISTISSLLKTMKGHWYRLDSFYEILRNKYDQMVQVRNLDEIREYHMRLNDARFFCEKTMKELRYSLKRLQLLEMNGEGVPSDKPFLLLSQYEKKAEEFGKRIKALQKEVYAITLAQHL